MKTNKEVYKIWAPENSIWSGWVRPVPFIGINENLKVQEYEEFSIPEVLYIKEYQNDTAIILDLPGNKAITEGLSLAKLGYRPVPIYNGTDEQEGSSCLVDNHGIEYSLMLAADVLEQMDFKSDAAPVFLTDSNRMNRQKMSVKIFDNSWDVYSQDLPTSGYLKSNGINKVIIRSDMIRKDINKIFYKFQKEGIKIYFTEGYEEPKIIKLKNIRYKN